LSQMEELAKAFQKLTRQITSLSKRLQELEERTEKSEREAVLAGDQINEIINQLVAHMTNMITVMELIVKQNSETHAIIVKMYGKIMGKEFDSHSPEFDDVIYG